MARKIVHSGRKVQVAIDEEVGPDGRLVRRDVVLHPGAVAILPLVDAQSVCLLENYRAVVGETLWEIAGAEYGVAQSHVEAIASANHLESSLIVPGQRLVLP